jgi:hypothetical protein
VENTNLQQLLTTLSKQEWRIFADFLASPYFNKNEKFRRFYQLLTPFHPTFSISEVEKKRIFSEATQTDSWNDAAYRNLCSDFLELVQSFLTQQVIQEGSTQKEAYLNRELIQRGQIGLVEKNLKKIRASISSSKMDVGERMRMEVWMNDLQVLLNIQLNRTKIHQASTFLREDNSYRTNTELLLLKVFVSFHNYVTASQNQNMATDHSRIRPFLELYEAFAPFEHPEVELNYLMLRMITEHDDSLYLKTKEIFIQQIDRLHEKDKSNLLSSLINHVNAKVSLDESWREEVFILHELKLSRRLWSQHSDLGYITLFNAIQNAIQMGRIAYAEEILTTYAPHLNQKIRNSIVHLCNAWISVFKGDFDLAHTQLTQVETENNLIKYEIRSLQAILFYEQKAWDLLSATLESFRQFIQYNKADISASVTDTYHSFVKQMQQLLKLPPSPTDKQRKQLIEMLKNDGHGYLKSWLLQKAEGL